MKTVLALALLTLSFSLNSFADINIVGITNAVRALAKANHENADSISVHLLLQNDGPAKSLEFSVNIFNSPTSLAAISENYYVVLDGQGKVKGIQRIYSSENK